MKALFILALLLLIGLGASRQTATKIVGGSESTIEQNPYQVAIEQRFLLIWSFGCGGVIIGPNSILTSGYCVKGQNANTVRVRSGSTRRDDGLLHTAVKVILHPNFVEKNGIPDNDIGIITVTPTLNFGDTVQPIKWTVLEPADGDIATVSGWGSTSEIGDDPPIILHRVKIPIIGRSTCSADFPGSVTENMICAGLPEGGKDACTNDGGGPLVVNGVLAGLVSWGQGCGEPNHPGVYTNVARYADWITEQLASTEEEFVSAKKSLIQSSS